jgi:LysM repeat protein
MMKKTQLSLPLGILVLLATLSLLTGCLKPAAPDVVETPAGGAQSEQAEEESTPDFIATAQANSAILTAEAGQTPQTEESQAEITPTPEQPTPTSSPVPTVAPTTAAVPTFTPSPVSPTAVSALTGQVEHIVQPGENLFRIALRYGTTVEAIASANGIANPAMIYVGQRLIISSAGGSPPPTGGTTYVVQPGDNLFRIALRYNMSYMYLAQYNNIANPASIYVGQVLRIP